MTYTQHAAGLGIGVLLSVVWLIFLRVFAGMMAWLTVFAANILFVACTILCYQKVLLQCAACARPRTALSRSLDHNVCQPTGGRAVHTTHCHHNAIALAAHMPGLFEIKLG
jgi:hypothetical protein